ncbi:MAG: dihydrofolate reductase family protein, partial [Williamsia herbipolensis]|nr:dihydrofolate reductase family protein [Williamsia herbipolensis]
MSAEYTVDLFTTLDGFAAPKPGTWGGYWGTESDEWLAHRRRQFDADHHMVFGADTYRLFRHFQDIGVESDPWVARMLGSPTTVVSSTLTEPLGWANATVAEGDAAGVVARLEAETDLPLRSHGSVTLNRALLAAGVVDRLQLTIFPVVTGRTGDDPIFRDGPD